MERITNLKQSLEIAIYYSISLVIYFLIVNKIGSVKAFGLVVISIVFLSIFDVILKSNTVALGMILTLSFTRILFTFAGFPRAVPVLLTEICIILLFIKAISPQIFGHKNTLKMSGSLFMLGVLFVTIVSYLANEPETMPAIFFIRQVFIYYLFFFALQNLDLSEKTIDKINKLIILLFLIQLPAALVKYITVGQNEGWIGTVSWQGAQFSTTLPLFAIAFLIAFYFFRREKKYLILIIGFCCFGIAGHKRALMFMIPVVLIFVWYLYGKQKTFNFRLKFAQLKYFIVIGVVCIVVFVVTVKTLETGMYNEGFNFNRIYENFVWYNTRNQIADYGFNADLGYTMGRFTITSIAFDNIKNADFIQKLFGFGPGTMIRSPHLGRSKETAYEFFGIYGVYTGFVITVLQVGLLGTLLLVCFYLSLFRKAYKTYRKTQNKDFKMLILGFLGATFVFLLDFFAYGSTTMFLGVLAPVYFYVAALILRGNYWGSQMLVTPVNGRFQPSCKSFVSGSVKRPKSNKTI